MNASQAGLGLQALLLRLRRPCVMQFIRSTGEDKVLSTAAKATNRSQFQMSVMCQI